MGFWNNAKVFMGFEEELLESAIQQKELNPVTTSYISNATQSEVKTKAPLIDLQVLQKKHRKNQSQSVSDMVTDMMITEPKTYEESAEISSYIKKGNPVIVNLKYLDAQEGRRLLDFVCGTVYAFEGNMQKLGGNIFLFVPKSFAIVEKDHGDVNTDNYGFPKHTDQIRYSEQKENQQQRIKIA